MLLSQQQTWKNLTLALFEQVKCVLHACVRQYKHTYTHQFFFYFWCIRKAKPWKGLTIEEIEGKRRENVKCILAPFSILL